MYKIAVRGLLAHKWRMVMTLAAVCLGVAFIGGVLMFTDTMQRSFDDLFETAYEGTDAVVRSEATIAGPGLGQIDERGTLDEGLLDTIRELPTVDAAAGEVEGFAQLIDTDGEAVSGGAFGGPTFVSSVDVDAIDYWEDLEHFGLRDGRWPEADDEIVVDAATERRVDYSVGDAVPVQTQAGLAEYTLVGTVGFGTADSAAGQSIVLFTTPEAQRTVGEPGRLDAISVIATEGTSQEGVAEDIRAAVGPDAEVLTGDEMVEETQSEVGEALSFLTIFFLVFAVIAVVVGGFVIYNSFSIIVAQRTREMALLRAVGATRGQVRRTVVVEAVMTGAVGSAIGFGAGIGLAALFSDFLDIDARLAILPGSVVLAIAVGLLVTVASSLLPAWRASRVAPIAAMRDVAVDTAGQSLWRLAAGLALLAVGLLFVAVGAADRAVPTVGWGVGAAFVGMMLAAPGMARPVSRILGWPMARLRGITGSLAYQNAARNPRRTASTGLALMIGVGIVAFFLVLNASVRASFDKIVDDNFAGDFMIEAGAEGMLGVPEEVGDEVAELPHVERVTPLRFANATVDGGTEMVAGTVPSAFETFGFATHGSAALEAGDAVVRQETAESEGLRLGDRITLDFLDDVSATVTVAGFYEETPGISFGDYVLSREQFSELVAERTDNLIVVDLAPDASVGAAREAIAEVVSARAPAADVQDNEDLKDSIAAELDVLLQIVLGLLLFAIVIAFFGIANTIALSVMERTREVGLLRAVGMSRRQLRAAVRWESVIIALFGTTLGMVIGVIGSWGMVMALREQGFEVFSLPIGVLAALAVLAGLAGVGAAVWPAWRASRLEILDAIHYE